MRVFNNNNAKRIDILDERFYQSKKEKDIYYPSVTTILEVYPKGFGFSEWQKSVGFNADEIMRKAGQQGTNVHNMIDEYLAGKTINWIDGKYTLLEWQMFCKFIEFMEQTTPEILTTEMTLVSDLLRYGGTVDCICKINGEVWLIDWKTSTYVHKSHELQLSAYATMWNELNPEYKIQRTGILHLQAATRGSDKAGKKIQGAGWQLVEFGRTYQDSFKVFQHTQAIWEEENPTYKPKNLCYPMEFCLKPCK